MLSARLIPPHYEVFGDRLPQALWDELQALEARLKAYRARAA